MSFQNTVATGGKPDGLLIITNPLPLRGMATSYQAMPKYISSRYFKTSPEIIWLAVILYLRLPLSLRELEDLLHERGFGYLMEKISFSKNISIFKKYHYFSVLSIFVLALFSRISYRIGVSP